MNINDRAQTNQKVSEIVETLNIQTPEGNLPLLLKLIIVLTLVGGLSVIGSLFVDIGKPSASVGFWTYVLRLIIGILAIATAYGLIKRERWSMWLYGVIAITGLYLNPITALIPGAVLVYLYTLRNRLKPSLLDILIDRGIKKFSSRSKK